MKKFYLLSGNLMLLSIFTFLILGCGKGDKLAGTGIILILGIVAFILFVVYFIIKTLEFVIRAINMYKTIIQREEQIIQILLETRDNKKYSSEELQSYLSETDSDNIISENDYKATCQECHKLVKLNDTEIKYKYFICPHCNAENHLP